jgi:hypothetical protein
VGLSQQQKGVFAGMVCAALLTAGAFLSPILPSVPEGMEQHLKLWLACSLLCSLWLMIGVMRLARHRFFTPEDIDGGGLNTNSARVNLLQAQLQNTLEQTVLAVIAYGAWTFLASPDRVSLVIIFSAYFAIGRLCFLIGYAHGAPARAFGFGLTFYPSAVLILATLPVALAQMLRFAGF